MSGPNWEKHPAAHRLKRDLNAALGQQLLNVLVAQGKAEVQPTRVLDDRGR